MIAKEQRFFQCNYCEEVFESPNQLMSHQCPSGYRAELVYCSGCNRKLWTESDEIKKTENDKFCPECFKKFAKRSSK